MTAHNFIDLTGETFGRLKVIERFDSGKYVKVKWKCICECGNIKIAVGDKLKNGNTKSCGCLRGLDKITHGKSKTQIYKIWSSMKDRCFNKKHHAYHKYGGRGITVCDRWKNSFSAFEEDMGKRPLRFTVERRDNNGDYCPENCFWASYTTQGSNKSNNHMIEYDGKTQTVSQWGREVGLNQAVIAKRLKNGWSIEKALYTPSRRSK